MSERGRLAGLAHGEAVLARRQPEPEVLETFDLPVVDQPQED